MSLSFYYKSSFWNSITKITVVCLIKVSFKKQTDLFEKTNLNNWTTKKKKPTEPQPRHHRAACSGQPTAIQTTDPANPQPPNHRSGQPTATQTPNHHRYNHSNTDPATEILTYSHPNTATTKNKKRGENRGGKEKKGRVREIGERDRERESTVIDEREKEDFFI